VNFFRSTTAPFFKSFAASFSNRIIKPGRYKKPNVEVDLVVEELVFLL